MIYLIYLIVFLLPLYLLRLKIFWIPTTVLELMIYVLFVVWLVAAVSQRRTKNDKKLFNVYYSLFIPVSLLLSGCIISILVSPYKLTSLGIFKGWFIDPLLFFMVLVSVIKTKKQIRNILVALGLSGLAMAIIGLVYFFIGNLTFDGRLRAFFLSPNHLAMYLAPALLTACFLLLTADRFRYFWLVVAGLMGVILYLTFSYGAWLGVIAGLLFLFWSFVKNLSPQKRKKIFLYFCIFMFLIVILGVFQLRTEKFQSFLYSTRSSSQSRLMIWRAGLAILKDHPLWGIGLGTFQKYYLDYSSHFKEPYLEWAVPQPHNLFLAFWLQTGILGLMGFIWIVVKFFKVGFRFLGRRMSDGRATSILLAIMIYILVHGLVDTTYWKNDLAMIFWIMIGLMVVLKTTEVKPQ